MFQDKFTLVGVMCNMLQRRGHRLSVWQTPLPTQGRAFSSFRTPPTERRGNNLNRGKNFYLEAKARIWPRLSYMCHIRSTVVREKSALSSASWLPPAFGRRCRTRVAHTRKSRPSSGFGFQVKVLNPFKGVPFSLGTWKRTSKASPG